MSYYDLSQHIGADHPTLKRRIGAAEKVYPNPPVGRAPQPRPMPSPYTPQAQPPAKVSPTGPIAGGGTPDQPAQKVPGVKSGGGRTISGLGR